MVVAGSPPYPAPLVADNKAYNTTINAAFAPTTSADLLINSTEPPAGRTVSVTGQPSGGAGRVVITSNTMGNFTFTPTPGWSGARGQHILTCVLCFVGGGACGVHTFHIAAGWLARPLAAWPAGRLAAWLAGWLAG